jgi:acetyl-CoA acetyltransferase family protein
MKSIALASQQILLGDADIVIAGGMESMSNVPFYNTHQRWGNKYGDTTLLDGLAKDGLVDVYDKVAMGNFADLCAHENNISRADQDAFAVASQNKAAAAQASGVLADEICPVIIPQKKGDSITVMNDEHPRVTSVEALAKLKGVVKADGTITAGNASGVNDGACALLLADEAHIKEYGLTARARIMGMATAGVAPRVMGIGPVPAVKKLLQLTGMTLDQMDVIELNEAFAAQGLAVLRELGIADNDARVNPNGGAIALGHPLGMSGARLVTTAMYQLQRTGGRYALCTMCIGVGQGIALMIERV